MYNIFRIFFLIHVACGLNLSSIFCSAVTFPSMRNSFTEENLLYDKKEVQLP
jgi:hypothetical protein